MRDNLVYSLAGLNLDGLFRDVAILRLHILHCLLKDLLHLPMLTPLILQTLA